MNEHTITTEYANQVVRTAQVNGPISAFIDNRRGDIAIKAVEGLSEARATISSERDVPLEHFAPTFEGNTLRIDIPELIDPDGPPGFAFSIGKHSWSFGNNQPRVRVKIELPADSTVTAETRQGDISLAGRYAEVKLKAGQGDISINEAASATCSTGSGDISIDRVPGDLQAGTGSGDISVADNGGRVKANTGSGDISVATVQHEGKLATGSGDIGVGEIDGNVKLSSGSGDFTIREIVGGAIQAQTASGDITFGVRRAIPVWTDCTTMTGEVSSNLLGAGQPTEGQPHIEIRATTVSGDITLTEV